MSEKSPWPDFNGNNIFEGDTVQHPSGESGVVVIRNERGDIHDRWFVRYQDGVESRLALQIGERGQAVVVPSTSPA